ncbi:MAG: TonB family protein [Deltaproteobacteria bacterium]|nr:TonB family protein [Deltaproteobacteria bacterium]
MRPINPLLCLTLMAAAVLDARPARAEPERTASERTGSPYFLVKGVSETEHLPLKENRADITIAGVIARVQVTQVYQNEGTGALEATYVFPASTRAAVFGMRMRIGERTIVAEIAERKAAKKRYEAAKEEGRSAGLLEQERENVFQMSVANIMPGDRVEVVLDYVEALAPIDGQYELVYPTVVGPRYEGSPEKAADAEGWNANPYLTPGEKPSYRFALQAKIDSGVPIAAVQSPSHRISPRFLSTQRAEVVLDDEWGGNRDFVLRYRLAGEQIDAGLLLYPGREESYFLLMVQPPARVAAAAIVPREYVFVLDVSGSMSGYPLDVAKRLIGDLLRGLRAQDRFNVVLFAGGSTVLSSESLPATVDNVARALEVIERERGGGGTEILGALQRAVALPRASDRSRSVVVITDGFVTVEAETFQLVRTSLHDANLFAFGVGTSVNRALIEGLARAGAGEPFVATDAEEAETVAAKLRAYVESPVLTQVAIEYRGFDARDVEPVAVPDLFAERPVIVFGKYKGTPQGTIELRGRSAAGEIRKAIAVSEASSSDDLVALRYLWARQRIARLSDERALSGSDEQLKEITQLGLRHGLLTEGTSFVAVDTRIRSDGRPVHVRQPLPLPAGVGAGAVGSAGVLGAMGGAHGSGGGYGMGSFGVGRGGSGTVGLGSSGTLGGRSRKSAPVISAAPMVMGSLDRSSIQRVIQAQSARIRFVYEQELLKNPSLNGRVAVKLVIDEKGNVTHAEISESTLKNPAMEKRILEVMRTLKFPPVPGGGTVVVTYPFIFRAAGP